MKYKKRNKIEIQEYFNNFPKIVKDKRGFIEFLKHSAHNKSLLELKAEAIYDKLSKSYLVVRYINYWLNEVNNHQHMHYEVIAFCCNCSVKLVEDVVYKLSKLGYLTHTINECNRRLKKTTREKLGCNPFKWVFKLLKRIIWKELRDNVFKRSNGWLSLIPKANLNLAVQKKLNEPDPPDDEICVWLK